MISVVVTCVNLNKMNVHVKNLKTKRQPIRRFRLTELIETMGLCVAGIVAKHINQMKFCNLTGNVFDLYMRRFFFLPSICNRVLSVTSRMVLTTSECWSIFVC